MENCISKISKDRFFALEEFMKKKTSFEKGRVRPGLDRLIGGTYTSIYSIKGLSRKRSVCLIETGMLWKNLFLPTLRIEGGFSRIMR